MKPKQNIRAQYVKVILAVLVMIILAGLLGWQLGKDKDNADNNKKTAGQTADKSNTVRSLISYRLPTDWSEAECSAEVHIGPGTRVCDASPPAPITVSVDSQNSTDCNQLDRTQGVQKHTCRSLFIEGRKSLQAETVKDGTTTVVHYINTGKGVIMVAYTYTGSNDYQTQYDQLLSSIDVKS